MKRWQYILFSTALAVIVLSVGTGSYLAIVRQERLEALEQTERDAEAYLEKLREARDQLREAEERLEALENMLLNLHQMQQITERSAAPPRDGHCRHRRQVIVCGGLHCLPHRNGDSRQFTRFELGPAPFQKLQLRPQFSQAVNRYLARIAAQRSQRLAVPRCGNHHRYRPVVQKQLAWTHFGQPLRIHRDYAFSLI